MNPNPTPIACSPNVGLAVKDKAGRLAFVARGSWAGSIFRTGDSARAETWDSVAEVKLWLAGLPGHLRTTLEGRELLVVPLTVEAGQPTHTLELPPSAPNDEEPPAPVVAELARVIAVRGTKKRQYLTVALPI